MGRDAVDVIPRRFRIWKDVELDCWRWECTFCQPPTRGARYGCDAFTRVVRISFHYHMRRRVGHHNWVRRHLGTTVCGVERRASGRA